MNNVFKATGLKKLKIGMRIIKTALAVVLCVMIAQALRLEYPFYAAIAAIISMGNSLTGSLTAGKNRVMGTIVGALIGLVFASIQPNNAFLCGLGIVLLFWICNLLGWSASIPIAGIVFMAIMVNLKDQTPLFYSLNRILDTVIGIGIALMINLAFYPHDHGGSIDHRLKILAEQVALLIVQVVGNSEAADLNSFQKSLTALQAQWMIYIKEWSFKKGAPNSAKSTYQTLQIFQDILLHLQVIQGIDGTKILNPQNHAELHRRYGINGQFLLHPDNSEPLNTVFNYHVDRIIAGLQSLEKQGQK